MGVYENIINSKKKIDEEESLYEKITGEKISAKDNYDEQRNILTKAQKEYSRALNEEYKKAGVFDFTPITEMEYKIIPTGEKQSSTYSRFDTKQMVEKMDKARNNVNELKTTSDEEYNKLKYAKYLKDAEKVASEKTTLWDKTGGNIARALKDTVSSIGMDKYTYIDENGNKIYLPNYNDLKQQKVSQDYDTKIGKFLGDTTYNASKILGTSAMNTLVPGVGTFTYYQDMYMDNYKNTVNQGYDGVRSNAYALTSTGLEFITGKFLGSATKKLTGGTSNTYSNALSNAAMRLTNNPTVSRILGDAGSEATEEFLQEYLDNINRLVTLENSTNVDDYVSIFNDPKILEDALYSAAVGAFTGGFVAGTDVSGNKNTNQNIQMFKEFKAQLEEAKKFTTDVSKIEQYDNAINKINEYLKKPFTNNEISLPKIDTSQEVNVQQNINNINTINKITEGLDLIESSRVYNIDSTSETIRSIDNLLNKRNINGRFDSTLFDNTKTNAFWTVDSNGNRNVIFNPNANTNDLLQNVAIHELTHDLLSSKNSAEILNSNDIIDYVSKIDGYEEARQSLAKSYSEVYDINDPQFENMVNEEVVASVLGNKLGNQEFVNRLTTENISLSKKIYNWIVDRINQLKNLVGYKSEKAYWNDVKNRFEKAYKMSYNNTNKQADTRFATINNNPYGHVKEFVKLSQKIQSDAHDAISPVAAEMGAKGKLYGSATDVNGNTYDFEIFSDMTYRVTNVEKYNNDIEEVINEKYSETNSRYSLRSTNDEQSNNDINNESNRNRRTGNENVDIFTEKQEQQTNNGYGLSDTKQEKNNTELDNSSFSYDNQGRTLTKEQQEYFKDSKVRDDKGNLLEVYHGTNVDFNVFNYDNFGVNGNRYGTGFYFTDDIKEAEHFTNNGTIKKVYLNIKKPLNAYGKKMSYSKFSKTLNSLNEYGRNNIDNYNNEEIFGTNENAKKFGHQDNISKSIYDFYNNSNSNAELMEAMFIYSNKMGLDIPTSLNIFEKATGNDGMVGEMDNGKKIYVTFNSNQIKNVDNTNPTSNEDIRYSQENKNWDEFVNKNFKSEGTGKTLQELKLPTTKNKIPTYKDFETKQIPKNPTKESTYDDFKEEKRTRKEVQAELKQEMGITVDDIQAGKDINSIDFQRTDPIRVNEKVFGYEVGKKINDATITKTKHNEAERTRFLNKERNEIKELGIKPRSKESAAVQKYGEKQYINQYDELVKYGDKELAQEFSDIETQNKIKNAAKVIRGKYDTYIDEINSVITELGYDPIPKRPDYMRHFQELDDKLSKWGIPLNPTDLNKENIPTDINGLTDQFKPGKNWFASAMARKGLKTTYDAITGIDGYLEGASNLMYHTEDIQRYRTLSKFIRETYGQTHGLDNIENMTEEQKQQRIDDVYNNKLSKYVAWLDEQANALAGKKGGIDRAAERILGRKIYTVLDTAKKQVGSNMTGFNVRSALTNFASSVQGASKTNKIAFIKGTVSTVQNIIHNDGLIDKSDFLTSRFGSDQLSKKLWQKASNAGQILMRGSDYFTANQIWRSKYFENLQKGMSEAEAVKHADDFASRIMGDRSKGSTAEIFNSKTLGLLTQFQLEVNNYWSTIMHDNKIDIKSGNKSGATVLFQLGQLAAMSYMFNNFMKSLTGSDVMLDPIDMLQKIIGSDDDDEEKTLEERATEVFGDLWDNLPFVSFLTGGRIPMSEAFTGGTTLLNKLTGQTDSYGNEIKWEDVKDDVISSAFYWLLPTGYGQLKKTAKGVSMYDKDKSISGSYTASGNLRFNADTSTGGKIKATLFGEYSSNEAQKYIDSGFKAISKSRLQEMEDLEMSASEYRKYRSGLSTSGTTNAKKINYIANSNYSDKQKNIMAKDLLGRDFNIKEYEKYDSYEEYDYAYKYPEKYAVVSKITSFDKYNTYKEKIDDIRANTTNDKIETIKYINSLNLSIPQKAMFIKMYYPSFDDYNIQIVNYVKQSTKTLEERTIILNKLGFTIKNGRVYW